MFHHQKLKTTETSESKQDETVKYSRCMKGRRYVFFSGVTALVEGEMWVVSLAQLSAVTPVM